MKVSSETSVAMPMRNLISIVVAVGVGVTVASGVTEAVGVGVACGVVLVVGVTEGVAVGVTEGVAVTAGITGQFKLNFQSLLPSGLNTLTKDGILSL